MNQFKAISKEPRTSKPKAAGGIGRVSDGSRTIGYSPEPRKATREDVKQAVYAAKAESLGSPKGSP